MLWMGGPGTGECQAGLTGGAEWQQSRVRSWAGGLTSWCGAAAGDDGLAALGSAITLPTLGHTFRSSWASPGMARWLILKSRSWTVRI